MQWKCGNLSHFSSLLFRSFHSFVWSFAGMKYLYSIPLTPSLIFITWDYNASWSCSCVSPCHCSWWRCSSCRRCWWRGAWSRCRCPGSWSRWRCRCPPPRSPHCHWWSPSAPRRCARPCPGRGRWPACRPSTAPASALRPGWPRPRAGRGCPTPPSLCCCWNVQFKVRSLPEMGWSGVGHSSFYFLSRKQFDVNPRYLFAVSR